MRENTPPCRLCNGGKETLDHMTNVCPSTVDIRQEYRQPAIYQSFGNNLKQQNKLGQFTNKVHVSYFLHDFTISSTILQFPPRFYM